MDTWGWLLRGIGPFGREITVVVQLYGTSRLTAAVEAPARSHGMTRKGGNGVEIGTTAERHKVRKTPSEDVLL